MKTIGVIGLGSIGMRHAENLISLGYRVLAYDPSVTIARGNSVSISTLDALIKEGPNACDAFVIASPTELHADHIDKIDPLDKPYFVEKPIKHFLSDTVGQSATMVGYNLRFHSCVIKAKEWIDAGYLGSKIWANFVCAQFNAKYNESVVLNWSHEIDLALYLIGSGSVVASNVRQRNGRDVLADIILIHENGCHSTVHLDYLTNPEVRQSIIVGEEASIIMDLVHRQAWLRSASGGMLDAFEGDDTFDDNYKDEMKAFLARIDGHETLGCTGEEAIEVLKICLDAKRLLQ